MREDAEARKARIRVLFDLIDDNHTGYLDADNILRRLDALSKRPLYEQQLKKLKKTTHDSSFPATFNESSARMYATELIKICDQTKDGTIHFEEFEQFVNAKEAELEKLFSQIAGRNKFSIGQADLKNSVATAGIDVTDAELQSFLTHLDADKNGAIDFDEWRDFLLLLPHPLSLNSIFKFYRHVLDVDYNTDAAPLVDLSSDPYMSEWKTKWKYFAAGGIAGAVSRSATAPLDRIRVLLQTGIAGHMTWWESAKTIYRSGGLLAFYRGNGLNVIKIFPESALKFFAYEYAKSMLAVVSGLKHKDEIGVGGRFVAGGIAGLISQFAIYPIETLKTRIMSQIPHDIEPKTSTSRFTPISGNALFRQACSSLWRDGGIRSFYRGVTPALVGIVPYSGIDLCVFETLKVAYMAYRGGQEPPSMMAVLCFGMVSGGTGACIMYPLSVVRTRLQAQGTPSHPATYTGAIDVITKTYRQESLAGFYKGLGPTLLKVVPAVSISYLVYERCKRAFGV
ncbi:hypothetical protein HDU76_000875 [Blyttiomyces sp. JEL0837]|nr:hypothetical protein HDU76_000875 [Blyttiomyces sp. JEL0837]